MSECKETISIEYNKLSSEVEKGDFLLMMLATIELVSEGTKIIPRGFDIDGLDEVVVGDYEKDYISIKVESFDSIYISVCYYGIEGEETFEFEDFLRWLDEEFYDGIPADFCKMLNKIRYKLL